MINVSIQINPTDLVPVKLLRDTAKYLLALSGAQLIQEGEFKNDVINSGGDVSTGVGSGGNNTDVTPELDNSSMGDFDIDGKEWDYKIHSSKKTKNQDGRWKLKRNTDSKIEIISQRGVTEQTMPLTVPPPPTQDLLGKLMSKITEKIVSGKMTHATLTNFLRENGIPDVPSIQSYPQLLPELIRKIEV